MNAPAEPRLPLLDLDLLRTMVAITEAGEFLGCGGCVGAHALGDFNAGQEDRGFIGPPGVHPRQPRRDPDAGRRAFG